MLDFYSLDSVNEKRSSRKYSFLFQKCTCVQKHTGDSDGNIFVLKMDENIMNLEET